MAPNKHISLCQEDFFYDVKWGQNMDNTFIDFLSFEARLGNFVWPDKTMHSLLDAKDRICMEFNENFSFLYCLTRLDVLEQRFNTFKWMLSFNGVTYNPNTNDVTAPDHVWDSMLEENTFSHAYLSKGEPKYEDLCVIFAPSPIDVVNVSSDEDTPAQGHVEQGKMKGARGKAKLHQDVGPSAVVPCTGFDNLDTYRGKGKMFEHHKLLPHDTNAARPPRPFGGHVNSNEPHHVVPKGIPLHLVDESDNSGATPPFNIWDYIDYFSDSESGATDISSANSYNCGARGQRTNLDRKKKSTEKTKKCRVSATDSCSPCPKEKQ